MKEDDQQEDDYLLVIGLAIVILMVLSIGLIML